MLVSELLGGRGTPGRVLSDLEVSVISEWVSLTILSGSTKAEVDCVAGGKPGGVERDGGRGGIGVFPVDLGGV